MTTRKMKPKTKRKPLTAKQALAIPVDLREFAVRTYSGIEVLCDTFHAMRDLTTRDIFALAALAGDVHDARAPSDRAAHVYRIADAMLKERAKIDAEPSALGEAQAPLAHAWNLAGRAPGNSDKPF